MTSSLPMPKTILLLHPINIPRPSPSGRLIWGLFSCFLTCESTLSLLQTSVSQRLACYESADEPGSVAANKTTSKEATGTLKNHTWDWASSGQKPPSTCWCREAEWPALGAWKEDTGICLGVWPNPTPGNGPSTRPCPWTRGHYTDRMLQSAQMSTHRGSAAESTQWTMMQL